MSHLRSIQVLRALAALSVTFGHVEHEALLLPSAASQGYSPFLIDLAGAGVDIFFVISGFVMVYASKNLFQKPHAASIFLGRRIIRIVPLYWMFTTVFLLTMLTSSILSSAVPTSFEILYSYLFIPYMPHAGIMMQPVYKLGWTLNYEMFFYCVFSTMLGFPRAVAIKTILALFLIFSAIGVIASFGTPLPNIIAYWTNPIILEFVMGTLIASAILDGLVVTPVVGIALMLVGSMGFALTTMSGLDAHGLWRPLLWGLPATLIVLGAIGVEASFASMPFVTGAVFLGDASYSLYLAHPFIIRSIRVVLDRTNYAEIVAPWLYVALCMVCVVPLASCVHVFFERPLTGSLARRLKARDARANAARAAAPLHSGSA